VRVAGVRSARSREGPRPATATARSRRSSSTPVRAAALRRARDPAPEDAAGRDLRRADAGHEARRSDPRGRAAADGGCADRRARRDLQALDPVTRAAFQHLAAGPREGDQGPRPSTSTTRSARCRLRDDGDDVLEVLDAQQRRCARLVKNTGVVFGALTRERAQLRNLIRTPTRHLRRDPARSRRRAWPRRSDLPDVPRRVQGDVRALERFSRATRSADPRPAAGARDLAPTLRDVRALAPDLERFFRSTSTR
jgi:hypothetical protein